MESAVFSHDFKYNSHWALALMLELFPSILKPSRYTQVYVNILEMVISSTFIIFN